MLIETIGFGYFYEKWVFDGASTAYCDLMR